MNPVGYRMEEKKEMERADARSTHSYKSTHSSRSSVLERAREYNRRIDEQNNNSPYSPHSPHGNRSSVSASLHRRAKSLERTAGSDAASARSHTSSNYQNSPRSRSAGRSTQDQEDAIQIGSGNRPSTRQRAMASVRKESFKGNNPNVVTNTQQQHNSVQTPVTPVSHAQSHSHSPYTPSQQVRPTPRTPTQHSQQPSTQRRGGAGGGAVNNRHSYGSASHNNASTNPSPRSFKSRQESQHAESSQQQAAQQQQPQQEAIVTPELLVDALSGHEDGLLAIAEKLMEHYDAGYDVMGEAIIDAFADVQKLFQHVVEAAHMEGAAFEASRREQEMEDLRKAAAAGGGMGNDMLDPANGDTPQTPNNGAGGPVRHDEFVDQDVKDVLTEAIRQGGSLRDANKHEECFQLYEQACQSASALLPVDSDHRGRLQLSIARAESMGPDRACAILRYAMDDVLRSGMRAGRTPLPDPSKRADVVLQRNPTAQSPDEALASVMEEMKEIMNAPVYNDTPLQNVAQRFWTALSDSQKSSQKNEERLEQSLGKLKGDFLLARAEWEEKLNSTTEKADTYKEKYERLKDHIRGEDYMEQARYNAGHHHHSNSNGDPSNSNGKYPSRPGSVASLGSGLAIHAKKLVNSINDFNCNSINERSMGPLVDDNVGNSSSYKTSNLTVTSKSPRSRHGSAPHLNSTRSSRSQTSSASNTQKPSRSFREYSKSPKRMDV